MDVKVNGQEIVLNNATYILPPLPLRRMAEIQPLMNGGNPMTDPSYVDTLVKALHWSLLRNYSDLAIETVQDSLDMMNYADIMAAFMRANGFSKPEDASGEVSASQ